MRLLHPKQRRTRFLGTSRRPLPPPSRRVLPGLTVLTVLTVFQGYGYYPLFTGALCLEAEIRGSLNYAAHGLAQRLWGFGQRHRGNSMHELRDSPGEYVF